jgi:transcriptional regulator with XRE-family HTH domain
MVLRYFEVEIEKILVHADTLSFDQLIRACRECLGLMQCKAAEFIGIIPNRLKLLEQGSFSSMPSPMELANLSRLYDIKLSYLEEKALEHVQRKTKRRAKEYIPPHVREMQKPAGKR